MKQLTRSEFNKQGTTYKSVTSPDTDGQTTQITDIVENNGRLAYSTNGSDFTTITNEVQQIDDVSTIYPSPNALPVTGQQTDGEVYCALTNGELPLNIYKFSLANQQWDYVDQVKAGVLYFDKNTGLLYVFRSSTPYFEAASYTDTNQLTNGANFVNKSYVDGLAQAGTDARQQIINDLQAETTARQNADTTLQNNINAKYTKPTGGIPASDLAQGVQDSLGLADSALQSINSSDVTNALGYTPYNATNPQGYTKVESSATNGNIKINGTETTVYSLPNTVVTDTELQAEVTTLQNSINAKYTKPTGGIPKTDLASGVQDSLDLADTALQSISSSDVTNALGYTPYNATNPQGYTKVESSNTNGNIKINGSETNVYTLPSNIATDSDVASVQSNLDAEITARGNADTTLQNNINTINGKIPSAASTTNQLADKNFVNSSINAFAAYYITKNAAGDPFATKAELSAATTFYSGGAVRTPTTNDYCIVLADETKQSETGVDPTTRYSYQSNQWEYQYTINNTPLTAAQLSAINSGITSALVTQIGTNQSNISSLQSSKQDTLSTAQLNAVNSGVTSTTVSQVATNTSNISSLQTGKQDKLTAGTNITIDPNTNTISATGGATITSINGLAGGQLTSALEIGTEKSGSTISDGTVPLIRLSNDSAELRVGNNDALGGVGLSLYGIGNRPTYNGNNLALASDIPTVNNATLTVQLNGSNVQTFTANQSTNATANIQALPNYSLSIGSTNGGNPRQVLFCSVNYTNFDSNSGAYFKLGAMSGHGNGSAYTFVEDIFINVNYQGTVTCQVYKYVQQAVTLDNVARNYGDVFYVVDTTNKIVYFYVLLGQYSSAQFTPGTKIGAARAVTAANGITQHTGTPTYYSSGTKVWATGDSATYIRSNDLATVATSGSYNDLSNKPTIPTDTGATSITTSGSGNAVTSASYDATTRQITLTKGSTFLTSAPVSSVSGRTGAVTTANLIEDILTGAAGYGEKVSAKSMGQTGYIKYASGLVLQWGKLSATNGTLTFPYTNGFSSGSSYIVQISSNSTNNAGMANGFTASSRNGGSYRCYGGSGWWFAIGY